jgi:hypothetical protein
VDDHPLDGAQHAARRYGEQDGPMACGQHEIPAQRHRMKLPTEPVLLNIDTEPMRARRLLDVPIGEEASRQREVR